MCFINTLSLTHIQRTNPQPSWSCSSSSTYTRAGREHRRIREQDCRTGQNRGRRGLLCLRVARFRVIYSHPLIPGELTEWPCHIEGTDWTSLCSRSMPTTAMKMCMNSLMTFYKAPNLTKLPEERPPNVMFTKRLTYWCKLILMRITYIWKQYQCHIQAEGRFQQSFVQWSIHPECLCNIALAYVMLMHRR